MATEYPVNAVIELRPIGCPWVQVSAPGYCQQFQLTEPRKINLCFQAQGRSEIAVAQFDKADLDPSTAVEIVSVSFFGIQHPKFAWAGIYYPDYPPHLQGQPKSLPAQTYLSWNGVWRLEFDTPVFTWMHQTLDLGWIYQ